MVLAHKTQRAWLEELRVLQYKTPFMVIDVAEARRNVQQLTSLLPRAIVHYAIKSNRDPVLIRSIDELVAGYEIASLGECRHLLQLGVAGDRMVCSNPVKIPQDVAGMYLDGVRSYSFDSLSELEKIAANAPRAEVYCRVKVIDSGSSFPLSKKFGTDARNIVSMMQYALQLGLSPSGLTFHVGSQSHYAQAWVTAIETCGQAVVELAGQGIGLKFLNIGGGIPASYSFEPGSYSAIAQAINAALDSHIPKDIAIVAEPGRAISASAGVIVASVIGREKRAHGEEWLFLDMGAFQGLIEPLQEPSWRYPIFADWLHKAGRHAKFTLTGPTCDPGDTIGSGYELPETVRIGDRIYIGAAGAYTTVYGSSFNGFDPPQIHYTEGGY